MQAVKLRAVNGGDRRNVLSVAFRYHARGYRGVFANRDLNFGMRFQVSAALADCLFVRKHFLHILQAHAVLCKKRMAHAKLDAAHDVELVVAHQIIHLRNGAIGTVFNGQYAVFAHAALHCLKHTVKMPEIHDARHGEQLIACLLGICALHALAGDDPLLREQRGCAFRRCANLVHEFACIIQ